ncbi:hypothetical protein DER44DRAFT_749841 [Fusarium oxysporum]|nr:hypothetical protein DER44DRAFT_749841 [Fusarium oxysporum]
MLMLFLKVLQESERHRRLEPSPWSRAKHVESNPGKIFALATKWQAILLLDEADVFLESGGRGNKVLSTDRNALVSEILRIRGTTKLGERKKPPTTRESSLVEIDAAFARTLGLSDGQEVTVALHLESPLVDTVNIEPLTREDWEIIELHASFLEFSLIRQVRALPNSGYNSSGGSGHSDHPITLATTLGETQATFDPSAPS